MKPTFRMIMVLLLLYPFISVQRSQALQQSVTVTAWLTDSEPYFLGDLNGELYFVNQGGLWKTSGAPAGTVPVSAVSPLVSDWTVAAGFPETI